MKFFFQAAIVLLFALPVHSQVQFSIIGGPQTTTASYTVQSVKQKTSFKGGLMFGASLKVPFENRLFFAPAIFYSMKGYKVSFTRFTSPPDSSAVDNNTRFHTLETACLLQYDFGDGTDHFYLKFGPSLEFQLFGNEKFNTPRGMVDRKIQYGYNKYGYFGANMHLQLGYEMNNGFFIQGQYAHGLANINNKDGGPRVRHRVFGISIGKIIGSRVVVFDTRNRQ